MSTADAAAAGLSTAVLRAVDTLAHADRSIAAVWAAWVQGQLDGKHLAEGFDCFAVTAGVLADLALAGPPHAAREAIAAAAGKYQLAAMLNARLYALDELDAPGGSLALREDAARLWDQWFPDFAALHGLPPRPAPDLLPRGITLELTP